MGDKFQFFVPVSHDSYCGFFGLGFLFFFLHMYEANIFSHNLFFKWKIAKVCIESIFARTWSVCSALMIRKEAVKYDFTIWKKKKIALSVWWIIRDLKKIIYCLIILFYSGV